jgi:hypothetical protein
VVTYFVFGLELSFFERNMSHLVPSFMILGGLGLYALQQFSRRLGPSQKVLEITLCALAFLALIRPLSLSWRLVFLVLNGRGTGFYTELEQIIQDRYPQSRRAAVYAYRPESSSVVHVQWIARQEPTILNIVSFHDPCSEAQMTSISNLYRWRFLAQTPRLFPELPVSTIDVYHLPTISYYLLPPDPTQYHAKPKVKLKDWVVDGFVEGGTATRPVLGDSQVDYVWGSWCSSDSSKGQIESKSQPAEPGDLIILYVLYGGGSGVASAGLDMNDDGIADVLVPRGQPNQWVRWPYLVEGTKPLKYRVVAKDGGSGWGDWIGISQPLQFSR